MNSFIVSPSPHIHSGNTVSHCMRDVIVALLPALAASLYFFGIGALIVTVTAVVSCMLVEYLIQRYMFRTPTTLSDGSALLTGLLLAFNLPSNLPIWIVVLGSIVAIGIGKMSFGGLGNNIFNPALVGRVFLLISFPVQMTSWPVPLESRFTYLDAATAATPLAVMKSGNADAIASLDYGQLFLGNIGGSMGEVSVLALLLGLVYLLLRKVITWHIPLTIFATVAIFSTLIGQDALLQLTTGGLMLGAIFMAPDYVTSPMTARGMILYGFCIGVLTVIIRTWGAYPEGVSFAILIMNAFTPLINTYVKPKRFGEIVKHG